MKIMDNKIFNKTHTHNSINLRSQYIFTSLPSFSTYNLILKEFRIGKSAKTLHI